MSVQRPGVPIAEKYKENVRGGKHQKIEEKLRRLANAHGTIKEEVYVERKLKAKDTITSKLSNLLIYLKVTFGNMAPNSRIFLLAAKQLLSKRLHRRL